MVVLIDLRKFLDIQEHFANQRALWHILLRNYFYDNTKFCHVYAYLARRTNLVLTKGLQPERLKTLNLGVNLVVCIEKYLNLRTLEPLISVELYCFTSFKYHLSTSGGRVQLIIISVYFLKSEWKFSKISNYIYIYTINMVCTKFHWDLPDEISTSWTRDQGFATWKTVLKVKFGNQFRHIH